MSPTSYQAAPPRDKDIQDNRPTPPRHPGAGGGPVPHQGVTVLLTAGVGGQGRLRIRRVSFRPTRPAVRPPHETYSSREHTTFSRDFRQ